MEKRAIANGAVAVIGSLALAGSVSAIAAPYAQASTGGSEAYAAEAAEGSAQASVQKQAVEGTFSYDQTALTPNSIISNVFCKAAATLCASLPDYHAAALSYRISICGPDSQLAATVDDLSEAEGAQGHVMACSCATNLAGGGAIANAEVTGVSLASVAQLVGAR